MTKSLQLKVLIAVLSAGMMFSSCGNIDIIKRKYRPGFHVDISKKREKAKTTNKSTVADNRKSEKLKSATSKPPQSLKFISDDAITASTKKVEPVKKKKQRNTESSLLSLPDFKNLSFDRKMKTIKNAIFKPKPRGGNHWMQWVAFGAGILSMALGFMALLLSFLLITPYLIWPAMILSATAIIFAFLYKNANGTDPKGRLGLIFGIIGGGLAIIALIVWAVLISQGISPLL
jgi:hypothetical protein